MKFETKDNGLKITFTRDEFNTLDMKLVEKYEGNGFLHYETPARNSDGFLFIFMPFVNRVLTGLKIEQPAVEVEQPAVEVAPAAEPTTVRKRDGMDSLRKDLSPLVRLSVKETFEGTMVISISIPNPIQFQASPFTAMSMTTDVTKTYYFADFAKQWSIEDWRSKMNDAAQKMLERARLDPVGFFQV
jgi:hypothetical protein